MVEVIVLFKIKWRYLASLTSFTKKYTQNGLAPGVCLSSSSHMGGN